MSEISNIDFFLRFTLISYAAIVFFAIGLRLGLSQTGPLKWFKLLLIFVVTAVSLSLAFLHNPLETRLMISAIWTSVLWCGARFGRKLARPKRSLI